MKKRSSAPALHEIQTRLQAAIMSGDETIIAALTHGAHASRDTLFGVYRQAYRARLIEVLTRDYPFLHVSVGNEQFRSLATAYLAAHPSRSPNVRWFGAAFPEFVSGHESTAGRPQLAELAAIERAVADAFDSADAPVLGFSSLAVHAPEHWEHLTFAFHPSVTLLSAATNAFDAWRALKDGEQPPQPEHLAQRQCICVWRQGTTPRVRLMSDEEAMMCREAQRGVRFGVLCEMLATFDDPPNAPVRAATYLQSWLASELLSSATMARKQKARATATARLDA